MGGADRLVFFAAETGADSLAFIADSLSRQDAAPALVAQFRAAADSVKSQEFLHRTFAVIAHDDTVWIGTSSGIAFTYDGGDTWQNARVRSDAEGNILMQSGPAQSLPQHPIGVTAPEASRKQLTQPPL